MISFLHSFEPQRILLDLGLIKIYWYGLTVVLGILAALTVSLILAKRYQIAKDTILDLSFWLIIGGIIGARIYDFGLQFTDYLRNPGQIFKIWEGGLAIHGAIFAGLIIVFIFSRHQKISFWKLTALVTPGLALGQAIGRWGNYFNQELFGLPTSLPWGIPISLINRPVEYINQVYFQPTFLYESLGCLLIFITLLIINLRPSKNPNRDENFYILLTALYMILYSILRFGLEFIRIDYAPLVYGWRWPQITSLAIILLSIYFLIKSSHALNQNNKK